MRRNWEIGLQHAAAFCVFAAVTFLCGIQATETLADDRPAGVPAQARTVTEITVQGARLWTHEKSLWMQVQEWPADRTLRMPRIANSIRSMVWSPDADQMVTLKPEPEHWLLVLPMSADRKAGVLELQLDKPLVLFTDKLTATADNKGMIRLPASYAVTHGKTLRFEPQAHKNTVGYWSNEHDTAEWHFTVPTEGDFEVDILQGCGRGHGGSSVELIVGSSVLPHTVRETGHFQNFVWIKLGTVRLSSGSPQSLKIVPRNKAAGAVMDVREVRLVPVGAERSFEPQLADPSVLPAGAAESP